MTSVPVPIATLGLTEVFSAAEPQVDIVFVHGLNGHPEKTWTAENNVFWPRDLLPSSVGDVPIRVLTYGYDARVSAFTDGVGKDHIHHHAENLAARLYSNRSLSSFNEPLAQSPDVAQSPRATTRPIVFVVHSLGGLVTKQCLIYSRSIDHPNSEHLRSIFVSTYGILFMGTPHNGSDLAKWGTMLQSIASATLPRKFFDSSSHLVDALKTNNETLQTINRQFTDIQPQLRIYFFYEARPMDLKGTRQFVVDEDSAAPNFPGVERMGIERDHSTMCKFETTQTPGFAVVAEAIQRYSRDAPAKIRDRWEEENQVRAFQKQRRARRELLPSTSQDSSRGTSPDTRSHASNTPLLQGAQRPAITLGDGSTTFQPYEIEEPATARLQHASLSDSVNSSLPRSSIPSTPSMGMTRAVRPMLVAPIGFRPNTHFVGFDIELARLNKKLNDEQRDRMGARTALLHGPPGCGKSHLARQYLWQNVEAYPNGIFWIDCKTRETLMKGFWNMSQSLRCYDQPIASMPEAFVDAVRAALTERDRWLLVFDGIAFRSEQDLEDFKRFIPDGQGSSIIYTTVDPTLANRQRLLDPPGIRVYPLTEDQACSLLFKSLQLREDRPKSSTQKRKARELVNHYQCLPLGIHAAAHALLARGRSLEKFTAGPSDKRLSTPFLSILDSLKQTQQAEAVNLLMVMCFLNHEVPVAMLHSGHKVLGEAGVEIRSFEYDGSTRRELDLSISTLIRNGLIERRLQTYASANGGRSSPEETRHYTDRQDSLPVEDARTADEGDSQSSAPTFVGIDVVRVHTVVQTIFLDHLKARTRSEYYAWLTLAAKFVVGAWNVCFARIKSYGGKGSTADYGEFASHAERVWSHFPGRPEGASQELRQARHELHVVRRVIREEIDNQSPSQSSQNSGKHMFISIFERSGSSSDEGPDTPTSGLTRKSTWSNDPLAPSVESPVEYSGPALSNFPISLDDSWHQDGGYLSDDEGEGPRRERTTSNSTEKALDQRQIALRAIFEGRSRFDVDAYRATPVVGSVSLADVEPHHSRSNSLSSGTPSRLNSTTSLAEAALSAVHKSSPPSSKNGGSPSPQRTERRPLSELSSNTQVGQHSADPRLSRTFSTSPHLRQAVLANTVRREQPPTDENVSLVRRSKPVGVAGRPFVPTLSTLESSTLMSRSMPSEYGPVPMIRDLSHESATSVKTVPVEHIDGHSSDGTFFTPPMTSPAEPTIFPLDTALPSPGYPSINSLVTKSPPLPTSPEASNGLGISNAQD